MRSLAQRDAGTCPDGLQPSMAQRPEDSRQSALSKPGSSRAPLERKPSAGILTTTTTRSGAREARITTTAIRSSPSCFPLQKRDQNAAPVTSKSPSPSPSPSPSHSHSLNNSLNTTTAASRPLKGSYRMAPEKQTSKPPLPTLARAVQRSPLTPKMATRAPPPPLGGTPLTRRNARPEPALGSDEVSGSGLFSSNVTPRSGKRQSRVDSANSTPTGTPGLGLGLGLGLDHTESWEARTVGMGTAYDDAPASSPGPEAKFFYASQAQKPAAQGPPMRPAQPPWNRASTFFYANGTPDVAPVLAPASTCTQTNAFKPPTSRPGTATSSPSYNIHQRPVSPCKIPFYSGAGASKHALGAGAGAGVSVMPSLRRTSSEAQQGRLPNTGPAPGGIGPSPNDSLTVAEPPAVARLMSEHGSYPSSAASSPPISQTPVFGAGSATSSGAVGGFASLLQAAEDLAEDEQQHVDGTDADADGEDADVKEDVEADDPLRELVASARRERKVQDLQIRNGSLEAINRSLERQLRKQTAELRRYRRLSRSGRLSLVPDDGPAEGASGRRRLRRRSTAEGVLSVLSEEDEDDDDDDDDEDGDGEEEDDEEEESSSDDLESADLSPEAMALRDARHRERDEARLRLDLSKHQQLLVDSQKMNQSLRRCLGWTEELIKEGRRALEYRVRVSEVELGGRVLAPEDMEGDDDDGDGDGDGIGAEPPGDGG